MPANALSAREAPPLLGDQTPRILVAPPAPTSAAAEAIEFCESVGLFLDEWQQLDLHHALGEGYDGRWSAFEHGLCVPRRNGKSALAEARILAGLFVFEEDTIVYSAHRFDTAMETLRELEQWLDNTGESFKVSRSNGKEGVELATGQRVKIKTRTKDGGRGLGGDCVILDEAMILDAASIGALMPTLAAKSTKVPGPQLWYLGSAVDQVIHEYGLVFSSVRKRALEGTTPRLCYLEWGCEDDADPADPRERARANPGMGIRITPEYIEDEYQAMKHTPKIFAVERLGIGDWPELSAALTPPIPSAAWDPRYEPQPRLVAEYPQSIGVDRDPQTKIWAVGGAIWTRTGTSHLELGFNRLASVTEMAEYLIDLVTFADPAALVIDQRSPAAILVPYLKQAGIEPALTNAPELAVACEGLVEAVFAEHVTHSGQQVLTDSVVSAVKRELPGGRFAWDKPIGGSVAQTMAVTLAHWGLLTFASPPKQSAPPITDTGEARESASDEFDALSAGF